jgi:hypothetical protein
MIIIFVLISFALGYAIAAWYQPKKSLSPKVAPPQETPAPPPAPSCLEDKIWYESELDFLFKFNETLSLNLTFQGVVQCITEAAHNFLPIERAALLVWDKNSQNLTLACSAGWDRGRGQGPLVVGLDSISGLVIRNRDVLLVPDLAQEEYLNKLKKEDFLQK